MDASEKAKKVAEDVKAVGCAITMIVFLIPVILILLSML